MTLSAKVRLAGTTAATTSARLVVKPAYTWVGNSSGVSTAAWTTLTGTYTVPDTGVAPADLQVYLGTDALSDGTATYDYYVDDVSITLPGVDCGGTGGGGRHLHLPDDRHARQHRLRDAAWTAGPVATTATAPRRSR